MNTAPVSTPPVVRVTVFSSTRRVDLVLPGAVPVAELLPELARSVGLLDASTAHGGYRVLTAGGRELIGDTGLVVQGVGDGWVLMVAAGVRTPPQPIYDDVVEAMADVAERDFSGWSSASGWRAAVAVAALLMTMGTATLLRTPIASVGTTTAVLLTTALTLVVVSCGAWPWLALCLTGTDADLLLSPADVAADPTEIDPARVRSDAQLAHQTLVFVAATAGLVLVLASPLAVSLGLDGTLLAICACLVLMLRTRRCRSGQDVLVGLASGSLGLASVALSLLWMHPEWRTVTAVSLTAAGGVVLIATLVAPRPSLRRGQVGDVIEVGCLTALLPLLVVATGACSSIWNQQLGGWEW